MAKIEDQSLENKKAWNYRAYEWWLRYNGTPAHAAADMKSNPRKWMQKHIEMLGEVKGKRILNPLGSNGRKAVPLALMGADVTVIDISEENAKYAMELANEAGVTLNYIVDDFITWNDPELEQSYDIAYMEGGILHYFSDLNGLFNKTHSLLKDSGKLLLNDFHPFRKILEAGIGTECDYFESELHYGPVPYQTRFEEEEQRNFPQCVLRYWTLAEILTAIGQNRFHIQEFHEEGNSSNQKVPGEFTVVAHKVDISV